MLLFLTTNMAAMTSRANQQLISATYFFFNPEFFLDVHVFQGNDSCTGRFF